jgi:hypothetical protein
MTPDTPIINPDELPCHLGMQSQPTLLLDRNVSYDHKLIFSPTSWNFKITHIFVVTFVVVDLPTLTEYHPKQAPHSHPHLTPTFALRDFSRANSGTKTGFYGKNRNSYRYLHERFLRNNQHYIFATTTMESTSEWSCSFLLSLSSIRSPW